MLFTIRTNCWSGPLIQWPSTKWSLLFCANKSIKYVLWEMSFLLMRPWRGNYLFFFPKRALDYPDLLQCKSTIYCGLIYHCICFQKSLHLFIPSYVHSSILCHMHFIIMWSFFLCFHGFQTLWSCILPLNYTSNLCSVCIHSFGMYLVSLSDSRIDVSVPKKSCNQDNCIQISLPTVSYRLMEATIIFIFSCK